MIAFVRGRVAAVGVTSAVVGAGGAGGISGVEAGSFGVAV